VGNRDTAHTSISMNKLSVIIPTLNEEKYIGVLLGALIEQTWQDFEVVVVDGGSVDKTGEVAREVMKDTGIDFRFVQDGEKGVSKQRNTGADLARHERLLFLDADVYLEPDFLEKTLEEMGKRRLVLATCEFEPLSTRVDDKLIYSFACAYVKTLQFIEPVSLGWCIFSTKKVHEAIGGFDESRHVGEDYDYVARASKKGFYLKVLKRGKVYTSVRRLEEEGRLKYYISSVKREVLRFMQVKGTKENSDYEFGKFGEDKQAEKFFRNKQYE
jgi:glycosyltransferase involved in cell wall biosynthesis